jgi:hypothetical protein
MIFLLDLSLLLLREFRLDLILLLLAIFYRFNLASDIVESLPLFIDILSSIDCIDETSDCYSSEGPDVSSDTSSL